MINLQPLLTDSIFAKRQAVWDEWEGESQPSSYHSTYYVPIVDWSSHSLILLLFDFYFLDHNIIAAFSPYHSFLQTLSSIPPHSLSNLWTIFFFKIYYYMHIHAYMTTQVCAELI